MISSSSDSELRPSGVSRNLAPEPQSLSAEISPSPRPERRVGGGGWAAAVSIINLKFSAATGGGGGDVESGGGRKRSNGRSSWRWLTAPTTTERTKKIVPSCAIPPLAAGASSRNLLQTFMAIFVHCAMAIWIEPSTTTTNHRGRGREGEREGEQRVRE